MNSGQYRKSATEFSRFVVADGGAHFVGFFTRQGRQAAPGLAPRTYVEPGIAGGGLMRFLIHCAASSQPSPGGVAA